MSDRFLQLAIELRATAPNIGFRLAVGPWRLSRRRKLLDVEMPRGWRSLAERHLDKVIDTIPTNERELFFTHLKVFALATHFYGAEGFEVEDRHRVMIAGRAAQMSRNLGIEVWDGCSHVVLYEDDIPKVFHPEPHAGIVVGPTVIMSWSAVHQGLKFKDGYDLTIHELAHVLDYRDLDYDGMPAFDRLLHSPDAKGRYLAAISTEYRQLIEGDESVLWEYAKTNRAEFFAVATEMFFEQPGRLAGSHSKLYDALAEYFRVDPLRRLQASVP